MNVRALVLVVLFGTGLGAAQEVPTASRQCEVEEENEWNAIWEHSLGVDGIDPVQSSIQSLRGGQIQWPAATDGLHQWPPFGPVKAKLCGAMRGHRGYCPNSFLKTIAECDRNAFILPAPGYEYLRDEPLRTKRVTDRNKMICCSTSQECSDPAAERCIETEITPSDEIARDPALTRAFLSLLGPESTLEEDPSGTKPWLWKEMCTYGPWVGDSGHGTRPEIHPVQLRWMREAEERSLVLMWMQDASARFTERRNFVHLKRPGDDWRPWAVSPVHGEYRVAFQADVQTPPAIRITRELGNHIRQAESDGCTPTEEGCLVEGKVGDDVVLRAFKMMPGGEIAVRVDPVCRRSDGHYIGYINIRAAVGHEGCGDEGYLAIRVEEMPGAAAGAKPVLAYSADPLFPKTRSDDSKPPPPSGSTLGGGVTEVKPGDLRPAEGGEAAAAWRAILEQMSDSASVGTLRTSQAPPVGIVRVGKWELEVEPHYEGAADAEPLDEREDINEALAERKGGKIEALNEAAVEFHLDASEDMQEVVDYTSGEAVPVYSQVTLTQRASPAAPSIRIEPWKLTKWSPGVRIRIPSEPANAVYRVTFRAKLQDAKKNSVPIEYRFLSHGVDGRDHRKLIEAMLEASPPVAELELAELVTMAREPARRWEDNRSASARASQLLVTAESYGNDGVITTDELEGLWFLFQAFRDAYVARSTTDSR